VPLSVLVGCISPLLDSISQLNVTKQPFSFAFLGHLCKQILNFICNSSNYTEIAEAQISEISLVQHTAIRLVEDHYISLKRPFENCTGVFTATTGLPCGHKVQEVKELGISFLPEDFHLHWHWDRYTAPSEPILQPLRVISYTLLIDPTVLDGYLLALRLQK
jgi:hypothetical protein